MYFSDGLYAVALTIERTMRVKSDSATGVGFHAIGVDSSSHLSFLLEKSTDRRDRVKV